MKSIKSMLTESLNTNKIKGLFNDSIEPIKKELKSIGGFNVKMVGYYFSYDGESEKPLKEISKIIKDFTNDYVDSEKARKDKYDLLYDTIVTLTGSQFKDYNIGGGINDFIVVFDKNTENTNFTDFDKVIKKAESLGYEVQHKYEL